MATVTLVLGLLNYRRDRYKITVELQWDARKALRYLWAWRIWQVARTARNLAAKELSLPLRKYEEQLSSAHLTCYLHLDFQARFVCAPVRSTFSRFPIRQQIFIFNQLEESVIKVRFRFNVRSVIAASSVKKRGKIG